MGNLKNKEIIFKKITYLKGVGKKLAKYLSGKKIEKINDLLWDLPYSSTDRSLLTKTNNLTPGTISSIKVEVLKYSFPRIRNLPNKVLCQDDKGKIEIVFFNSRENYIKAVLPLKKWVLISGKVTSYNKKYQIANPEYISSADKTDLVLKNIPKYSLTDGLNEKSYRKIVDQVINILPELDEWHPHEVIKKFKFSTWKDSIINIHEPENINKKDNKFLKRLAFDEICSNMIVMSKNRTKIKKNKKEKKYFKNELSNKVIKNFKFNLTKDQVNVINEINVDLASNKKMFRILQGDVGSGKTVVSIITSANVIESGFQTAIMAPTDILAKQHYNLAISLFNNTHVKVEYLSGKTEIKIKNEILKKLKNGKIDLLIGTHSLFQKKILFKKLGYIIIDEQHKFGVKQRMMFAEKGGSNCDVLLMSATPIPRTMVLTIYGDMDVSKIFQKPNNRKSILTYSKPENKIDEVINIIKNNIKSNNQVFWVCPLIKESKILDFSSTISRYEWLKKKFPNEVSIMHGKLTKDEKNKILNNFLEKKVKILVSTTVIEVGIDFPNANLIIIENANKFGLAQLHQLRGRVGRGNKQGICILLFKKNLSKNSINRIKILKKSNDGFFIAEEDMKMRGFGDMVGFQQSGEKYFKLADPIRDIELFNYAENYIKNLKENDFKKYDYLLKLFDKAEIIYTED